MTGTPDRKRTMGRKVKDHNDNINQLWRLGGRRSRSVTGGRSLGSGSQSISTASDEYIKKRGDTVYGALGYNVGTIIISSDTIDLAPDNNISLQIPLPYVFLQPESGTADDLVTINGIKFIQQELWMRGVNDTVTITIKNSGNIRTIDGNDFALAGKNYIKFVYDVADEKWVQQTVGVVALSAGGSSPLTTKGDIFGFSTTDARIPVGADSEVLIADSAEALGVRWGSISGTVPSGSALNDHLEWTGSMWEALSYMEFGATPADIGSIRNSNNIGIAWRNAANNANHSIVLTNIDEFEVDADWLPATDGDLNLGAPTQSWDNAYLDKIRFIHNTTFADGQPAIGVESADNMVFKTTPTTGDFGFRFNGSTNAVTIGNLSGNLKDSYQWVWGDSSSTNAYIEKIPSGPFQFVSPDNFRFDSSNTIPKTIFMGQNTGNLLAHYLQFQGESSTGVSREYGSIKSRQVSSTNTSEQGSLEFALIESGVPDVDYLILDAQSQQVQALKNLNMGFNDIVNIGGETINGLTPDTTPDGTNDYVMTYDDSTASIKKVLLNDIIGVGLPDGSANRDHLEWNGSSWVAQQNISFDNNTPALQFRDFIDSSYITVQATTGNNLRIERGDLQATGLELSSDSLTTPELFTMRQLNTGNGDMLFSTTGDKFTFLVNSLDQLSITENTIDVHDNGISNYVGWTASVEQTHAVDGLGSTWTLPFGDLYDFRVDGGSEFTIGSGAIGMNSPLSMNTNKITSVVDPDDPQDAATKAYVDAQVSGGGVQDKIEEGNSRVEVIDTGSGVLAFYVDDLVTAQATMAASSFNLTGVNLEMFGNNINGIGLLDFDATNTSIDTSALNMNFTLPTSQAYTFSIGGGTEFLINETEIDVRNKKLISITYSVYNEITAPDDDPGPNTGWLYGKDVGGVTQPFWEDEAGTVTNLITGGGGGASEPYATTVQTPSSTSGTLSIDLDYHTHTVTVDENITTINFANVPAPGQSREFTIRFDHDGVGGTFQVDFPASAGSNSFTLSSGQSARYVLHTEDGGTSYEIQTLIGATFSGGFSGNLSDLTIDANKDWNAKNITNINQLGFGNTNALIDFVDSAGNGMIYDTPTSRGHLFTVNANTELELTSTILDGKANTLQNWLGIIFDTGDSIINNDASMEFNKNLTGDAYIWKLGGVTEMGLTENTLDMHQSNIINMGPGTISLETTESTIDATNDFLLFYDASAGALRKTAVTNVTSAGTTLTGLSDTNITSPANGHHLVYNSTSGKWENLSSSGGDLWSDPIDSAIVTDGTPRNVGSSGNRLGNTFLTNLDVNTITVSGLTALNGDVSLGNTTGDDVNVNGLVQTDIKFTFGNTVNFNQSQSTVGSAGSASSLPSQPTGYIIIKQSDTEYVVPYYAKT